MAKELHLETPAARLCDFLIALKRTGKFSMPEVEELLTLLVTSKNINVGVFERCWTPLDDAVLTEL